MTTSHRSRASSTHAELRDSLKERVAQQSVFTQGSAARQAHRAASRAGRDPVPPQLVEDEVHTHLEGEGRLEDDVHRAEVTEASEKQFWTRCCSTRSPRGERLGLADELTQYLVVGAQYGMAPQDFVNALQENNQLPAIVGEVARTRRSRSLSARSPSSTPTATPWTSPASSPSRTRPTPRTGRRRGGRDRGCRGRGRRDHRGRGEAGQEGAGSPHQEGSRTPRGHTEPGGDAAHPPSAEGGSWRRGKSGSTRSGKRC
jgi:hypothetical protein